MRNLLYVSLILVAVIGISIILALMFFRNLPKPTPLTDVPLLLEGVKIEPPVTSEKVRGLIAKAGLSKYADDIEKSIQPSVRITTRPAAGPDLEPGKPRLGGQPDLPEGIPWPEFKRVPMSFIGQIRFADVSGLDSENLLPDSGILYFFYDAGQMTWGFDPKDRGGWKVIYYNGNMSDLRRTEFPDGLPQESRFLAAAMSFSREITVPQMPSAFVNRLGMTEKEQAAYCEVMAKVEEANSESSLNRMLGYPNQIQGDMQLECQLVSHGLYCGDERGYNDPKAKELEKGAADWILLLQVDSDDNTEMMWGDVGILHFWIPKDALKARDFDKVWISFQCM